MRFFALFALLAGCSNPSYVAVAPRAVQVSSGLSHSCGLWDNGMVACWGRDDYGQLGNGTVDAESISLHPQRVRGLPDEIAQVECGNEHCCTRTHAGEVWCWGDNTRGQLGDGTTTPRYTPVRVVGLDDVDEIVAGGGHTCARVHDGSVRCWGTNGRGQLGDGTVISRLQPTPVLGLDRVSRLALGLQTSCARRDDFSVRCWGTDLSGQLGDGGDLLVQPQPVVSPQLPAIDYLAAGAAQTSAVDFLGDVWAWGGSSHARPTRLDVPTMVAVASAIYETCGLSANQEIWCWGPGLQPVRWAKHVGGFALSVMGSEAQVVRDDGTITGVGYDGTIRSIN